MLNHVESGLAKAVSRLEKSVLQTILDNRLLLAAIVLLFLLVVPALIMCGGKLRDSSRPDRRKHRRIGVDRRA